MSVFKSLIRVTKMYHPLHAQFYIIWHEEYLYLFNLKVGCEVSTTQLPYKLKKSYDWNEELLSYRVVKLILDTLAESVLKRQ